jgi:hypothetical protein
VVVPEPDVTFTVTGTPKVRINWGRLELSSLYSLDLKPAILLAVEDPVSFISHP